MTAKRKEIVEAIQSKLSRYFSVSIEEANKEQMYKATVLTVRDILANKRKLFNAKTKASGSKKIYYMCMEFLMGPSLRTNLCNLELEKDYAAVLKEYGYVLDDIYEMEPDPGLGNGGLGRLAACFMDSLSTLSYPARGYSILYEYGLFKQKLAEGEQIELPDVWLPGGDAWIVPRQDKKCMVRFGGKITEKWDNGRCEIIHEDYEEVEAIPYDMMVSGANSEAITTLRLWKAQDIRNFNMELFSQGQYVKAVEDNTLAQTISKVLYPNDNHPEGKLLRLSQQYFLVSASLQNIIHDHIADFKDVGALPEKVAIHINDTHPALCIPELMRILMDIHNYSWETAWDIVTRTLSYTNHTVMPEALECWNEGLFRLKLPRLYMIIREINERFCAEAWNRFPGNWDKVGRMSVINHGQIRMANLSVIGSHAVNGVSQLHTDILKSDTFRDFNDMYPGKFLNVTNGIAHRRWLCYSNPRLSGLLDKTIGKGYRTKAYELEKLLKYKDDSAVLDKLAEIKRANKADFSDYMRKTAGVIIDPDTVFDVQVKRIHEYKRQMLNALHIISVYCALKENPDLDILPKTYIFGGKAAPGYYLAKDVIRLICYISEDIQNNPKIREKLNVVFLENYNVSLAERLMPAADVSEQISLAGKEASGTGNMKFMINGAVTIGTLDGANVEICEEVGNDNIFIFGHTAEEVDELWKKGYSSAVYYNRNESLKKAIDYLQTGFAGRSFSDVANYLLFSYGVADPYMCLADFDFYQDAHKKLADAYKDKERWNKMSLVNIAKAGKFAADRSISDYANNIWNMERLITKK